MQRQEITFNVHFQLSSDLSHFTLHHLQREKESYLFIKCQNVHLPLQGTNTYNNTQNLCKNYSVTEFFNSKPHINSNNFSEYNEIKEISYYIFGIKTMNYLQKIEKSQSTHVQLKLIKKKKYVK